MFSCRNIIKGRARKKTDYRKTNTGNTKWSQMPSEKKKKLVLFSQQSEKELLVIPWSFLGNSMLKKNTVSLVVNLWHYFQILLSPTHHHTGQCILISSNLLDSISHHLNIGTRVKVNHGRYCHSWLVFNNFKSEFIFM